MDNECFVFVVVDVDVDVDVEVVFVFVLVVVVVVVVVVVNAKMELIFLLNVKHCLRRHFLHSFVFCPTEEFETISLDLEREREKRREGERYDDDIRLLSLQKVLWGIFGGKREI